MAKRTTRKSRYSAEQVAAAKERDARLSELAEAAMADPKVGARVAALAGGGVSMRILSYSIRNQTLLMEQAAERGMPLRDVDTLRGWRERGRAVLKGSKGLRIVRPVGTEMVSDAEPAEAIVCPGDTGDTGEDADSRRPRFRMASVFELSQTEGIEDEAAGALEQVEDPAAVLAGTLTVQAQRAGYTIAWGEATEVDHDARTLTAGEDLDELAAAVAAIATSRRHQAAGRKARPVALTV